MTLTSLVLRKLLSSDCILPLRLRTNPRRAMCTIVSLLTMTHLEAKNDVSMERHIANVLQRRGVLTDGESIVKETMAFSQSTMQTRLQVHCAGVPMTTAARVAAVDSDLQAQALTYARAIARNDINTWNGQDETSLASLVMQALGSIPELNQMAPAMLHSTITQAADDITAKLNAMYSHTLRERTLSMTTTSLRTALQLPTTQKTFAGNSTFKRLCLSVAVFLEVARASVDGCLDHYLQAKHAAARTLRVYLLDTDKHGETRALAEQALKTWSQCRWKLQTIAYRCSRSVELDLAPLIDKCAPHINSPRLFVSSCTAKLVSLHLEAYMRARVHDMEQHPERCFQRRMAATVSAPIAYIMDDEELLEHEEDEEKLIESKSFNERTLAAMRIIQRDSFQTPILSALVAPPVVVEFNATIAAALMDRTSFLSVLPVMDGTRIPAWMIAAAALPEPPVISFKHSDEGHVSFGESGDVRFRVPTVTQLLEFEHGTVPSHITSVNEARDRGIRLHSVMAGVLPTHARIPTHVQREIPTPIPDAGLVTVAEMSLVNATDTALSSLLERTLGKDVASFEMREQRLFDNREFCSGAPDLVLFSENYEDAVIVDYKFPAVLQRGTNPRELRKHQDQTRLYSSMVQRAVISNALGNCTHIYAAVMYIHQDGVLVCDVDTSALDETFTQYLQCVGRVPRSILRRGLRSEITVILDGGTTPAIENALWEPPMIGIPKRRLGERRVVYKAKLKAYLGSVNLPSVKAAKSMLKRQKTFLRQRRKERNAYLNTIAVSFAANLETLPRLDGGVRDRKLGKSVSILHLLA